MFHRPKGETQKVSHNSSFIGGRSNAPSSESELKNNQNEEESKTMNAHTQTNEDNEERTVEVPGAANYTNTAAGRMPGSYPGSSGYSSPSYGAGQEASASNGRRLVVGQGITMSGEIESCDHLVVEGTIEAALKGASILEISESGVFYGTVEIDEATIAGRFEGDLTVNGRLTIKSSGSITGAISYRELAVEAGAVLDGKIGPLKAKGGSEKKPSKAGNRSTAKNEEASKKTSSRSSETVSEEGGLFGNSAMEAAE